MDRRKDNNRTFFARFEPWTMDFRFLWRDVLAGWVANIGRRTSVS